MSLLGQTQTKGFGDEREFRGLRLLLARLRLRRCATFRTGPVEQVDWANPPYGLWRCEASSSALLSVRGTKMAMSAASILQQSSNPHGEERVFARLRTMLRIAGRTMRPISRPRPSFETTASRSPQDEVGACRCNAIGLIACRANQ